MMRTRAASYLPLFTAAFPGSPVERDLTNAQRLARGLPLKRPRHIARSQVRRQAPSSTPTVRGHIRVDRADGSGSFGFLSVNSFSHAQYRYESIENAATVSFPALPSMAVSQIEIMTEVWDGVDALHAVLMPLSPRTQTLRPVTPSCPWWRVATTPPQTSHPVVTSTMFSPVLARPLNLTLALQIRVPCW
jgi:hypothetical protein